MRKTVQIITYTVADPEFYEPLETAGERGERYAPGTVPAHWRGDPAGVWTMWSPAGLTAVAEEGWKVHVSARPERVRSVLDTVASVCFEEGVPFKHLATKLFFWWTQQRHGSRQQGGKFIAAYPSGVEAARRLMERLRTELADEEGPYILSDRRYKDSRTVHYRYGAFTHRSRVQPDGRSLLLVRDGHGALVPDRRGIGAQLPAGLVDPFAELAAPGSGSGSSVLRGFVVDSALQFSNGGGVYKGHEVATGRIVVVKEGRSHTGLGHRDATATEQLRQEWTTLAALRETAPGLAPEPIVYFRAWEHEFMVTEFVPGEPMGRWVAANNPLLLAATTAAELAEYYDRCQRIVTEVEDRLRRLHSAGYLFGDVSPNNVLIGPDDSVRLIDFGSATRIGAGGPQFGTPGYAPSTRLSGDDPTTVDDYGVSALAMVLLSPLNQVAQHNSEVLGHAYRELSSVAPPPAALWRRVTRYHDLSRPPRLATPEQVAADPVRHLTELRDGIADALVAMADPGHDRRVFPTIADGYETNTVCVAFGTAGVVHALRHSGRELPDGVLDRLRRDALAAVDRLAPGLHAGSSGVARVLADCGLIDEARHLLAAADRHPLAAECATLAGGAAGLAVAHLALYGRTGDLRHVDRALGLADALPSDDELTPYLGSDNATGLLHGRAGVALMLHQLAEATGDTRHLARAVRLLHAELDRATDPGAAGLLFPISESDRRAMSYVYCGSAGMAYTVTRCLRSSGDERLAEALPRLLASLRVTITVMPGLYQGVAGFAFALADHARLTGDEASRQDALRAAFALYQHAVPHATGVRFLGDGLLRFSAELWSGSAGVLLGLNQVLVPQADGLFAVDTSPIPLRRPVDVSHRVPVR